MPFPDHFDPVITEELPGVLTLSVPREELDEVVSWAQRFASGPMNPPQMLCLLSVGVRRWVCSEANVVAWIDHHDSDQRETGVVVLPHQVLDGALLGGFHQEAVTFVVDRDAGNICVGSAGFSFTCGAPPVPERVPVLDFPVGRSLVVSADRIESAAAALRTPFGTFDGESQAPWPYVVLDARDRGRVRLSRDWSEFNGDRVEAVVHTEPISNEFDGTVAFYPEVVLRELWVRTDSDGDVVRFSFFSECPDTVVVTCDNWGVKVALGSDFVLRYRRQIEGRLAEAGFEVDQDERRDWSPVVRARVNGRDVVLELLRAERIHKSHVRITAVVAEGLSWSAELGGELNSWNDAWSTCKLLFREGTLLVVRDIPAEAIETLPAAVEDLVERTMAVHDVVGPLM